MRKSESQLCLPTAKVSVSLFCIQKSKRNIYLKDNTAYLSTRRSDVELFTVLE